MSTWEMEHGERKVARHTWAYFPLPIPTIRPASKLHTVLAMGAWDVRFGVSAGVCPELSSFRFVAGSLVCTVTCSLLAGAARDRQ